MKYLPLGLFFALWAGVAAGQESRSGVAAPLPRIKLDPVVRAAVASSTSAEKNETPTAEPTPVMLNRFVVKGVAALPFVQQKEPVLRERFTPLRGGSFVDRNFGKTGVFLGLKPWVDIFEDDARFKHPAAARINFTLFQLSR